MGHGCEVGAVGLEQQIFGRHFAHGLGQSALFEGDYAANTEQKIATRLESSIGCRVLREGVENTIQALSALTGGRSPAVRFSVACIATGSGGSASAGI